MKRIIPNRVYAGLPCSMVACGCAMGFAHRGQIEGLRSPYLSDGGFLSLTDMNHLVRAHMRVRKRVTFKHSDERPALRDFAHTNLGRRAVVCVWGHYVYFDGRNYHSFLWNGGDPVVSVWYLD